MAADKQLFAFELKGWICKCLKTSILRFLFRFLDGCRSTERLSNRNGFIFEFRSTNKSWTFITWSRIRWQRFSGKILKIPLRFDLIHWISFRIQRRKSVIDAVLVQTSSSDLVSSFKTVSVWKIVQFSVIHWSRAIRGLPIVLSAGDVRSVNGYVDRCVRRKMSILFTENCV